VDTYRTPWLPATPSRDQRSRRPGVPQRPADGSQGQPLTRSLPQAAGMAPVTDMSVEHPVNDIETRGRPLIQLHDAHTDTAQRWAANLQAAGVVCKAGQPEEVG